MWLINASRWGRSCRTCIWPCAGECFFDPPFARGAARFASFSSPVADDSNLVRGQRMEPRRIWKLSSPKESRRWYHCAARRWKPSRHGSVERAIREAKSQAKIPEVQIHNLAKLIQQQGNCRSIQSLRTRCEHLFAEGKEVHGLDCARSRGLDAVEGPMLLTVVVQNLKRLC
jgi:hypothetical protein